MFSFLFWSLNLVPKFSGMKLHFIVLVCFSDSNFSLIGMAVVSSMCRGKSCTVFFFFLTIDIFGPLSFSVIYQQRCTIVNLKPEHRQRVCVSICLFPHNCGGYFTWLLVELIAGKNVSPSIKIVGILEKHLHSREMTSA